MGERARAAVIAAVTFALVTGGIVGIGLATVDPARAEVAGGFATVRAAAVAAPLKPAQALAAARWDATS